MANRTRGVVGVLALGVALFGCGGPVPAPVDAGADATIEDVDAAGTDTYDATGDLSFGHAAIETVGDALRRATGSYGIFLERGGTDTYARPTIAPLANDATWTQSAHEGESEHGAGIDRAEGTLGISGLPD